MPLVGHEQVIGVFVAATQEQLLWIKIFRNRRTRIRVKRFKIRRIGNKRIVENSCSGVDSLNKKKTFF